MVLLFAIFAMAATPQQDYGQLRRSAFSDTAEMKDRWESMAALSKIKHKDREKDILRGIQDTSWYMRNVSLLALDSINAPLALKQAIKLLEDPSLVVRSAAADVIAKSAKTSGVARDVLWKELRDKQNRIQGASLWIRPQIMKFLSETALPQERKLFLTYTEDSDSDVQNFARQVLVK